MKWLNHTTRTRKHNTKIWSPDDKQWLLGHVKLFPLFGRSNSLLIPCHTMVKDWVHRPMPGDVASHIAPIRTTSSKRGLAFIYWGILSLLWIFYRLYSSRNCLSSRFCVLFHCPAPSMLPVPQHCSSGAKFTISCNYKYFYTINICSACPTNGKHQTFRVLWVLLCHQAGKPTLNNEGTL